MIQKKPPMRKCIGCMQSKPKKELIRVLACEGAVIPDLSGKLNGRGAYICADIKCLETAIRKNAFGRNLGVSPDEDQKAELFKVLEAAAAGRMDDSRR